MRPSAALAVALAVLALASAAATLPSATSDAPTDGSGVSSGGSSDSSFDSTLPESPASGDGTGGCLVGCAAGPDLLDRLPTLPAPGPGVLALVVAAALGGLSLLAYRATGDEGAAMSAAGPDAERTGPPTGAAGGGRPAPADAAADNAVYRAWLDLADDLTVPRVDARTPAELAAAAVDAGADAAAVSELRGLFVAVRYGGRRPTGDREERARAARRRATAHEDGGADSEDAPGDDGGSDA